MPDIIFLFTLVKNFFIIYNNTYILLMKKNKKKVRLEVYRDDGNDDTDGRPAVKPDIGIDVQF